MGKLSQETPPPREGEPMGAKRGSNPGLPLWRGTPYHEANVPVGNSGRKSCVLIEPNYVYAGIKGCLRLVYCIIIIFQLSVANLCCCEQYEMKH